jgi:hypothetical protein
MAGKPSASVAAYQASWRAWVRTIVLVVTVFMAGLRGAPRGYGICHFESPTTCQIDLAQSVYTRT